MQHAFDRQPCKVIRLNERQRAELGIAESNRVARQQFEQKIHRDERLAREKGMRAAAEYNHKLDVDRANKESLWLKLTSALSLAVFLLLWSMWA